MKTATNHDRPLARKRSPQTRLGQHDGNRPCGPRVRSLEQVKSQRRTALRSRTRCRSSPAGLPYLRRDQARVPETVGRAGRAVPSSRPHARKRSRAPAKPVTSHRRRGPPTPFGGIETAIFSRASRPAYQGARPSTPHIQSRFLEAIAPGSNRRPPPVSPTAGVTAEADFEAPQAGATDGESPRPSWGSLLDKI